MNPLYADASAIVRAYFDDEPGHEELRTLLLESGVPVVTSELARVELAAAVRAAGRARRVPDWRALLDRVERDCGNDGPITLLELRPPAALATAHRLVLEHDLRSLDALHLAVALEDARVVAGDEELVFVTRDRDQATAAAALGLAVA